MQISICNSYTFNFHNLQPADKSILTVLKIDKDYRNNAYVMCQRETETFCIYVKINNRPASVIDTKYKLRFNATLLYIYKKLKNNAAFLNFQ